MPLYLKDSRFLKEDLQENSIHAVVTDPPYGMNYLGYDWDKCLPPIDIWRACFEVLRPGGFLLAFGYTRLYHRLGCQIEDVGFEIKDCLSWVYATSFPQGKNAGLEIDRIKGHDRDTWDDGKLTEGITEDGKIWNGYSNLLKTAWEPIILAQKPLIGSIAENVLQYKCGVLNIDACRIPYDSDEDIEKLKSFKNFKGKDNGDPRYFSANEGGKKQANVHPLGRWPANLMWLDPLHASYDRYFIIPKPAQKEKRSYNEHSTVKPVRLMEHLVSLVTPKPSDIQEDVVVLDPFMGSGTTGIACKRLQRNFVGYEIDQSSFDTATRRISEKVLVDLGTV